MLSLPQARRRQLVLRWGGQGLSLLALVALALAAIQALYLRAEFAGDLLPQLAFGYRKLIESGYAALARVEPFSGLTAWTWRHIPTWHIDALLFEQKQWQMQILVAALMLGVLARARARVLRQSIAEHLARVQQLVWEMEARRKIGQWFPDDTEPAATREALELTVQIPSTKLPWQASWWGLVVIGVAVGLLVEVLKLVFGLAKFTPQADAKLIPIAQGPQTRRSIKPTFAALRRPFAGCLFATARLELKSLMGQPVLVELLTQQSRVALRPFHAHVSSVALLGSDGGLARYRLL
jgi:hypothetical protein